MKSLKERLEEKIESNAWKYDTAVGGSCHMPSYKEGAASLATLVLELENKLKEISEKEGMCIFGSSNTSDLPEVAFRQGSAYSYSECASTSKEALQSIEKFLGDK